MKEARRSVTLKGIPVSEGIVIQKVFVMKGVEEELLNLKRDILSTQVEEELDRLDKAYQKSDQDLAQLAQKLSQSKNKESVEIVRAHQVLLGDQKLRSQIEKRIREECYCAEYAVALEIRLERKRIHAQIPGDYFRFHGDFQDLEGRLLRSLQGTQFHVMKQLEEEVILIAEDLTPEQTLSLDLSKIKGIATDFGGPTSHTAIVAKTHNLPAVMGLKTITQEVNTGDVIILDGKEGKVIIHPERKSLNKYLTRQNRERLEQEDLISFSRLPVETLDGQKVFLYANIESPDEIPLALERGASGIGLYRTEFLLKDGIPTEQRHFEAYWKALKFLKDKPFTIRTLDMGGDKFMEEAGSHREANPFLGCRSIRLCLRERPELFLDQLRAILRISAESDQVRVMFPMISTMSELHEALEKLEQVKEEFREKNIPFNEALPVGIMVEIPSTAIMADNMAKQKKIQFFSIGTNDLIQYTLAVDRNNERVAHLYKPVHPAVLRLIRNVILCAHQNQKEVSMCGEMPSDVTYALLLLGMGLQHISVNSASIPRIVKAVRQVRMRKAIEISNRALKFELTEDIQDYLLKQYLHLMVEP